MVSHVGIISKGKMLFQGSLHDLNRLQNGRARLMLKTSDNTAALSLLSLHEPEITGDIISINNLGLDVVAEINRKLVENNIDVYLLHPKENDLEQLYRDLTSNQL